MIIFENFFFLSTNAFFSIIFQISDSWSNNTSRFMRRLLIRSCLLCLHPYMYILAPIWRHIMSRTLTLKQVDTSTCRHVRIDGYKLSPPYHVLAIHDVETSMCCAIIDGEVRLIWSRNIKEEIKKISAILVFLIVAII